MMILMAIFWILIIVGAVVAIRWLFAQSARGREGGPSTGEAPIEILKRRYARGEIAKQEFEEMRRDLEA
ncbi:MAG: SHOCT domain-containing protein [Nitrospinota bacterium]